MAPQVYWGGGSANYAVSSLDFTLLSDGPERFEVGTLPFLDIISLQHGQPAGPGLAASWCGASLV